MSEHIARLLKWATGKRGHYPGGAADWHNNVQDMAGMIERLAGFARRFAEEPCHYEDDCPPSAKHYRCDSCLARDVLRGH